jgi:hypothetical protein
VSEPTDGPSTGASTESSAPDGKSVWTWLLPALTFLVGAALSAVLFAVGDTDDTASDRPLAGPSAEPTSDDGDVSTPDEEVVVQVPSVCVEAAELAQTVTAALGDVADAAGALDARRLQESLDVVQQIRPEVEATARECRDLALAGRIVTPDPTGPPTPTPSPSSAS